MKAIFSSNNSELFSELSVENVNDTFVLSIYDTSDNNLSQTISINFEEATELIKFLESKMKV